jgi:hypothetical protein
LNQSLATEEKGSIVHIENAQAAVGTLPFVNRLSRAGPRFQATNPANQLMEGTRLIERVAKFDPRRGCQKCGQAAALRSLCTWQENGDHAEKPLTTTDPPINSRTHFFVLPGAKPAGTHKDGASFRFGQRLLNSRLPRIARNEIPFVKPSLNTLLCQSASYFFNNRFIGAAMGKKDMKGRCQGDPRY